MKHTLTLLAALVLAPLAALCADELSTDYDVVVAGAGTGGCGAAIQAARMGASVLLLEETDWLGGQTAAAGVTSQDYATPILMQSGLYREFCERIETHYKPLGKSPLTAYFLTTLGIEPRVAQSILKTMLHDTGQRGRLDVSLESKVTAVKREGDVVTGATVEMAGKPVQIHCRVLIDATEWGDVIPLTGLNYRVGNGTRDANKPSHEIQHLTWTATIRKYDGAAPAALRFKAKPPGYEEAATKFEKAIRPGEGPVQVPPYLAENRPWFFSTFIGYRAMPDSKRPQDGLSPSSLPIDSTNLQTYRGVLNASQITRTNLNNSNDYPVQVRDVEDATSRRNTLRAAELRTLQLLYHLQQTLGHTDWSVADDEGYDTPLRRAIVDAWITEQPEMDPFREILSHFSAMAYARESRRIVGLHTLTAADIERRPGVPQRFEDVVALSDYMIDLHGGQQPQFLEADLDPPASQPLKAGQRGYGPFGIPMRCFIPEQLDGFLAAEKNFSQSRLANGATRLQPSTMLMGQAVGALAALSVKHQRQPRAIDATLVQHVLLEAGCLLHITPLRDIEPRTPLWAAAQLCAVHGLLLPVNGWFGPDQLVTANDWAEIQRRLLGKGNPPAAASSNIALTRGKAALVLADILHGRAAATLGQTVPAVDWQTPRIVPPTPHGDLTSRYLLPARNWWMSGHADFAKWKEPRP